MQGWTVEQIMLPELQQQRINQQPRACYEQSMSDQAPKPREVTQSYADFELPNGKIAQATEGICVQESSLSLSIKWNTV